MGQTEPFSLSDLNEQRFSAAEWARKTAPWKALYDPLSQNYVTEADVAVDLGACYSTPRLCSSSS